ncbi:MAG: hypothetical protein EOO92_06930 [Pedobacter sp.]|nr:MAG: hypothetical protein EOO92_06930 [Pedobacter sp.]
MGIEQQIDQETFYEDSGFDWLKMNKLELHFYNIRHLQHHIGQLVERLNQSDIGGSIWIGKA